MQPIRPTSAVRRGVLPLLALLAAQGCFCSTGPGVSGRVDVAPPGADAVRLVFLGVGGWIMERGDAKVLAAPLFSNPAFVRTGLLPIRSDTAVVDRHMSGYSVSGAEAILVGHAHYDHLMDVPRVAKRYAPEAKILGSRAVRYTLGTWSGVADRVVEIDDMAGNEEQEGRWIEVGDGVRVMPLLSHHAPHFEGYTLYKGSLDAPLTEEPRWASEWLDGPTYAFLVDFLDPDGSVAFRVYYQDAVAAPPRGFAPRALMDERPVDVAIFVPATFDQVDWHPEAFVENLRPRWVLLGHWENFFKPPESATRSILLSDIGHFQDRLRRVFDGDSWLPEIGPEFRFPIQR